MRDLRVARWAVGLGLTALQSGCSLIGGWSDLRFDAIPDAVALPNLPDSSVIEPDASVSPEEDSGPLQGPLTSLATRPLGLPFHEPPGCEGVTEPVSLVILRGGLADDPARGRVTTCPWDLENPGPVGEEGRWVSDLMTWDFDPITCAVFMTAASFSIEGRYATLEGEGYGVVAYNGGPPTAPCPVYRDVTWRGEQPRPKQEKRNHPPP